MKLTLGTTYYNNPDYLLRFIDRNINYVDELIVVDDGSSLSIENYVQPTNKIKLFKVKKDYGFNSHGCRNLIMSVTSNSWNILIDIDREFTEPDVAYFLIKRYNLNKNCLYRFNAHGKNFSHIHNSVNDYLINRDHFFSAGGYDEEIIGQRWGDREYFKQLEKYGTEELIEGVFLELTRISSVKLKNNASSLFDKKIDKASKNLIKKRIANPKSYKPILTFKWEEIKGKQL